MSFLTVLPLVLVMISGPQILSAIFLATSEGWQRNSTAFVLGAALSISLVVAAAFFLGGGAIGQGFSGDTVHFVILVLLLIAMVRTFLKREQSEPPKWMGKLQAATPRFSLRLGFLLLGFFPTDVITSVTVGSYLAAHDSPLTDAIPFVLVTLLLLALPSLAVVALGERAEVALPKIRDWMNTNSWIVSEVVLLLFVAITLNGLLG
ncbi:GAP family protein [Halococcus sediminicola]|uniref:GAP family protein n=1 Tax=Halococcus sediminicola TaxID=1264579 RepID=UPI000678E142|nr:GAP family protein [Halococcus sediminicola]